MLAELLLRPLTAVVVTDHVANAISLQYLAVLFGDLRWIERRCLGANTINDGVLSLAVGDGHDSRIGLANTTTASARPLRVRRVPSLSYWFVALDTCSAKHRHTRESWNNFLEKIQCLPLISGARLDSLVMLLPGRDRLATNPLQQGRCHRPSQ